MSDSNPKIEIINGDGEAGLLAQISNILSGVPTARRPPFELKLQCPTDPFPTSRRVIIHGAVSIDHNETLVRGLLWTIFGSFARGETDGYSWLVPVTDFEGHYDVHSHKGWIAPRGSGLVSFG